MLNPNYYNPDVKRITSITFTVSTNPDIKLYSAIANEPFGLNKTESYNGYKSVQSGPADTRGGTSDPYIPCLTCGLNYIDCPGHFMHIALPMPVYHIGFLEHTCNILKCICLKCSKLLVPEQELKNKKTLNKKQEYRFKEIKLLSKNITSCSYCGTLVPKIKKEIKEKGTINILIETSNTNDDVDNTMKTIKEFLLPKNCLNIFRNVSDEHCAYLGFNIKYQRPEDYIIENFPVAPITIRPTARLDFLSASTMEHGLTLKIVDIITKSNQIRQQMEKGVSNMDTPYNQDLYTLLQYHVATYFDNKTALPTTEFKTGNRIIKSISDGIKGKTGRVRSNLMGKRVEFSARTVITPDPYININQVGIPRRIAVELTIPEEVTPNNINYLSGLVKNGRDVYPGANFVLRNLNQNGKNNIQKIDLKYRKSSIKLNIGDVVERHCIDGDYVLFNRQPTLHKPSMMGHSIKVLDNDNLNTFRMNISVCGPYGADFDGDEMNIFLPQSIQARNELKRIADVKYQIIGAKESNPIIGCTQDTLSGAYILSHSETGLYGWEICNILCNTSFTFFRIGNDIKINMNKKYSGKDIFSYIIPNGINIIKKSGDNITFQIENGKFIKGSLDKSSLSLAKNSIIHIIWDKYGPDRTSKFIDDAQKLVLNYTLTCGTTIGFKDVVISKVFSENLSHIINNKLLESKYNITQFENDTIQLPLDIIETLLATELNALSTDFGQLISKELLNDNFLNIAAKSGAKGNISSIKEMIGCIGQTIVEGVRIKKKIENRTLIYFHSDDDTPEARGFIKSSFLSGLKGIEFFYNAMAAREGLMDTALKTAQTGYIQRQLIKGLEDLSIKYDGTNRNAKGTIIQLVYGENGINQSSQSEILFNIIRMNNKQVNEQLCLSSEEIKKLKDFKNVKDNNNKYYEKLIKLRDELRQIQSHALLNFKTLEEKFVLPINLIRITQDYTNINIKTKSNTNKLDLDPNEIEEHIELFLTDYNNRIITCMKKTDKYMIRDDRNLKFLLETALYEYLCPKKCIFEYKLNKNTFLKMMEEIKLSYYKSIIDPGEMVGIIAAQSIGEPTSQMSAIGSTKLKVIIKNKTTNELTVYGNDIGSFCDKLINENPILTYDTNHNNLNSVETELDTLDNDYYIIGVDNKEKTHWNKISHVSRHPVNGDLITIKTKSGRTVTTTLSHSHLIRKNQTVLPILGSELKLGMRVPVAKYIDNSFINDTIKIGDIDYKLDFDLGCFFGIYFARGTYCSKSINIYNCSEYYINNIKKITKLLNSNLFLKINLQIIKRINKSYITFTYNDLTKFINNNFHESLSIKKIPEFIFIAPNEFKEGFIQAYINNTKYDIINKNIIIQNENEKINNDISLLLNYCGMFCCIDNDKLIISSKYVNLSEDIDKINGLEDIINSCCENIKLNKDENIKLNKDISRKKLNTFISIFENHDNISNELEILKQAYNSNVIWDEIINIDIYTPDQTDYVYDFTVPGNETFMVNNGIIIHNTLNTKHSAGQAGKGSANMGVNRIQELVHNSKNIKTPQMQIYFNSENEMNKNNVKIISSYFKHLIIRDLISVVQVYYLTNNNDINILIKNDNTTMPFFINNQTTDVNSLPFVFRIELDIEKMLDKEITLLDIKTKFISHWQKYFMNLKSLKKHEKEIISVISRCAILSNSITSKSQIIHIRFSMSSFNNIIITDFMNMILDDITLKGIENITNINTETELKIKYDKDTGSVIDEDKEFVVYTSGINFEEIKYIKGLDMTRTKCNNVNIILKMYGIEATRQILLHELYYTYVTAGNRINPNHLSLLIDQMCHTGLITSIDRNGMAKLDIDPIARASFEKTMDHFIHAALFNESDNMKSISSRIALGQVINGGTGSFDLLLDTKKLENSEYIEDELSGRISFLSLEEEPILNDIMKYTSGKNDFFNPLL